MHSSTYEERRARLICLSGIVMLSVGIGFVGGRYSAVVIPVPDNGMRAAAAGSSTAIETSQSRQAERPTKSAKNEPTASAANASPAQLTAVKDDNTLKEVAREQKPPSRAEERTVFGATVLNGGAAELTPASRAASGFAPPERLSDSVPRAETGDRRRSEAEVLPTYSGQSSLGARECARRYASFRESDGTYQPYGAAERKVCPLLR